MPLLNNMNVVPYCEDDMQQAVKEWILGYNFWSQSIDSKPKPKVYREIHVPEIGRRSDLIVFFSNRKIFNIECKLFNVDEVIKQAKDHLLWADYSYVCLPHNVYIPNYQRSLMIKNKIGLLYWIPGFGLIEGILGAYNLGDHKDKQIRHNVLRKLKKIDRQNSQQKFEF